jgi:hypothetical protein
MAASLVNGGGSFCYVAYEQAPAGPTGALSYFLGNAQLLDGARCWERPRLVDKKFGKYSRFSGNAPECPTTCLIVAAIVTLGFFLLLAQASRMLTFGAADTAPVPW